MHCCVICIGSNSDREVNLSLARQELMVLFPSILFGKELETKPLFLENQDSFSNQLALFYTKMDIPVIQNELKHLEYKAGRRLEDKKKEKVLLDIDLLIFDNIILKPEDLKRDYIAGELEVLLPGWKKKINVKNGIR